MADIGWIFSDTSIRSIIARNKTQTRRLIGRGNVLVDGHTASRELWSRLDFDSPRVFVDSGPSPAGNPGPYLHVPNRETEAMHRVYPRWHVGQRVWVRETWRPFCEVGSWNVQIDYAADGASNYLHDGEFEPGDWIVPKAAAKGNVSPLFMPRWASRITLTITEVRAQRLHEISVADARAEGISEYGHEFREEKWFPGDDSYRNSTSPENYLRLWNSLNGTRAPADSNPLVWAYTFDHTLAK